MVGICVYFLDLAQFLKFLKGCCHGNQFCVIPDFFSLGAKVSEDLLDRFSQSLHHMVGIELQMINPTFFRYLKGPIKLKKSAQLYSERDFNNTFTISKD